MKRLLFLFVYAGLAVAAQATPEPDAPAILAGLQRAEVHAVTSTGTYCFRVWIADDDRSRAQGLMYIKDLPANQGMLFLFDRPQPAAFWMKNTLVSLDIVFIAPDGIVIDVARGTEPMSLTPIESPAPVAGVLELVAGTATRIGLAAGGSILHPAFSGAEFATPSTRSRILRCCRAAT